MLSWRHRQPHEGQNNRKSQRKKDRKRRREMGEGKKRAASVIEIKVQGWLLPMRHQLGCESCLSPCSE
ncbi:uncharacterized [Tachysurus ichikawai]